MIDFEEELTRIFGDKYQGCTQRDDELVEYRLNEGEVATAQELAQVDALPKGMKAEFAEIKAKVAEIDKLKDDIILLKKRTEH